MADTPNHEYNVPDQGVQDWHNPLNENFETFDVDIELRDEASTRGNYTPAAGAKFLATDTGVVYLGNGSDWVAQFVHPGYDPSADEAQFGRTVTAPGVETDSLAGALTGGQSLTDIAGNNLTISNGRLDASTGGGGGGSNWQESNSLLEPSDSNVDGIDVDEVHTAAVTGTLTGGASLDTIAGNNLSISNGRLDASTGGGGNWTANNSLLEPSDASIVGIEVDDVNAAALSGSLTGGAPLDTVAGNNLSINNGQLDASTGDSEWQENNGFLEPTDSSVAGIDVDELRAPLLAAGDPLTLTVDGARALKLTSESGDDAGNVVAGHSANSVDSGVVGATISGGGSTDSSAINVVFDNYGTVGGGSDNQAGTDDGDPTTGAYTTVAGGQSNTASASLTTVSGGRNNDATGLSAVIGGGISNEATGFGGTIAGGEYNRARAEYATVSGGGPTNANDPTNTNNVVYDKYGTIGGGGNNQAGNDDGDPTTATHATVGGGESNEASAEYATVAGGGSRNVASGSAATVGGGSGNKATERDATVGGGRSNRATDSQAVVSGGESNKADAQYATVAGGLFNEAVADRAAIGGGAHNLVLNEYGTICGGGPSDESNPQTTQNAVFGDYGTVGGGGNNRVDAKYATITGGRNNEASGEYAFVAGRNATASEDGSFVVGDSTSDSVDSFNPDEARFQQSLRSARLKTESGVWYYENDGDNSRDWRTTYLPNNDHWSVSRWSFGQGDWVEKMWVTASGDIKAQGSKDFVDTVDTDTGEKEVHYTAAESGTPHTDVSGVADLEDGRAEIDLPDHFGWVTSEDDPLHVQTTPYSADSGGLAVVERSTDRLVVEDLDGAGGYEFSYTVRGTREGYADKEVVREPSATATTTDDVSPADD